jgi:nucleoside 2-deoxyribosyltransferase
MKIFVICSVRIATPEYRKMLEDYVFVLEKDGHIVHLPHRDTNQEATEFDINNRNMQAIKESDEVHIFYSSESLGTHFDMGVAFALNKKIKVIQSEKYGDEKSYARMLRTWENCYEKINNINIDTDNFTDFAKDEHVSNLKRLGESNYKSMVGQTVYYVKKSYGEHKIINWCPIKSEFLLSLDGDKFYSNPFRIFKK